MGTRRHDPLQLDVAAAAADGAVCTAAWPLHTLARLAADHPPEAGPIEGEVHCTADAYRRAVAGGEPEVWLRLQAHATLWRTCQRCLQPAPLALAIDRSLRFVAGEEAAAALDADSDDDVLALPPALDLRELAEDELLLALPIVPRHAQCPQPLPVPADELAAPPNPFAALAALKRGTGGPH